MKRVDRDYWMREAVNAHTDLVLFNTIIAMVESGDFSSDSQVEQFSVVRSCKRGMAKSLARYDRARAKAGGKDMRGQ